MARSPRPLSLHRALIAAVALWLGAADGVEAQPAARRGPRLVARADIVVAGATGLQGALGITLPAGNYVRVDAVAGGGIERSEGASRGIARGDLVARFVIDPFRQARWAPYGGAGVTARRAEADWQGYLLAVLGVEGPPTRGVLPALELGLGGGTRIGLVLRGSAPGRR